MPTATYPLQRPPRVNHFTGREKELTKLLHDLHPGRVVTLCGPGGIGKTALSSAAVSHLAPGNQTPELFPDGIVFYSFYGKPDMASAFEHIVRSFDRGAKDTSPDAARQMLEGKQALLILDGVEEAEDIHEVLKIHGRCGFLVTSRKKEDAEGRWEDILPLPIPEAAELLRAVAGDRIGQPEKAVEICGFTGGLPLAVQLAGHYMATFGMHAETYLEWLKDSPLSAMDHEKSVPRLLERSIAQVAETSEQAQQALAITGLLALAPFSKESVGAALGIKPLEAARYLGHFFNYGLLTSSGTRYEISHPLVHTYVCKHLSSPAETTERLTAFFIDLVRKQSAKGPEGYARLNADRIHLMRILSGCMDRKAWKPALEMAWEAESYMNLQGHWVDRITLIEAGLESAKNLEKKHDTGAMLGNLGIAYNDLGQMEKAIGFYEQALDISRETDDRQGEGTRLGNLGTAYRNLGQVKKAIGYYEKALVISRETDDRRGVGKLLGNLGTAYCDLGQEEKAIGYYEKALVISRKVNDWRGEGNHLSNLGTIYHARGQVEKAIEFYEQALDISRKFSDRPGEGIDLGDLGEAYGDLGQAEKAIEFTKQSLARLEKVQSPLAEKVRRLLKKLEKGKIGF